MKIKRKTALLAFLIFIVVGAGFAYQALRAPVVMAEAPEKIEVTVYNTDLGVVKEYRSKYLDAGVNRILYEGVAALIDPTSVHLKALGSSVSLLEQNFQYDLVSKEKLLQKYVGKNITAYQNIGDTKELVEGTLLAYDGGQMIIKGKDGKIQVFSANSLTLPDLPEGLIIKPTLEWILESDQSKNTTLELSYMTSGMSWNADYVAVVNGADDKLDLTGWVTVINNAGATFNDATLKLVAGDVNRVQNGVAGGYARDEMMVKTAPSAQQFTQENLFEYHMYDLNRKTTLNNNEQKQIELMSADGIPVEKEYVFESQSPYWWYGYQTPSTNVKAMINLNNTEGNGLGIPLPKGTLRVFKADSSGQLQFIGEDSIDHTPKDETVRVYLGDVFDVKAERKQMDYRELSSNYYEYTWETTIKNHKNEDISVTVLENTGGDWEITKENIQHVKESNNRIKWTVPAKANSETKLTYTIRYHTA
ncbi:Uncharacterised protein [uncultured archaeon]|nr:Uncharacterised protein [uncultured archaeon]